MSGGTLQTQLAGLNESQVMAKDPFCLAGGSKEGHEESQEVETDVIYPFIHLAPAYNTFTATRVLRRSGHFLGYGALELSIKEGFAQRAAAEQHAQQFVERPKEQAKQRIMCSKRLQQLGPS